MKRTYRSKVRAWIALAVICGGGLLPGTCAIRTRQSIIDGSKTFLGSVLLDPELLSGFSFDDTAADLTGG